jgi:hypothetical protein
MAALNRFADILGALRIVSLCTATMSRSGPTFAAKIASVRTRPARGQYLVFSGDAELSSFRKHSPDLGHKRTFRHFRSTPLLAQNPALVGALLISAKS